MTHQDQLDYDSESYRFYQILARETKVSKFSGLKQHPFLQWMYTNSQLRNESNHSE